MAAGGAPYAVSGAVEGLMISRWTPPQRVQRMVQYSAPARPGMMLRTESEALQSGQFREQRRRLHGLFGEG